MYHYHRAMKKTVGSVMQNRDFNSNSILEENVILIIIIVTTLQITHHWSLTVIWSENQECTKLPTVYGNDTSAGDVTKIIKICIHRRQVSAYKSMWTRMQISYLLINDQIINKKSGITIFLNA